MGFETRGPAVKCRTIADHDLPISLCTYISPGQRSNPGRI
ncbi:hypothetical protein TRICHSKD4_3919 [Roseibium sp. TrichSKD4]|nr:hypothetical protein TRICHSKD4_3919 [Roseibium sp. TrichSKD4]